MFDPSSRYAAIDTALYVAPDGTSHPYKLRRMLPQPVDGGGQLRVGPADRLDLIAARLLGDPLQFWRIADANTAMNPFDLTRPGTLLTAPTLRFGSETKP